MTGAETKAPELGKFEEPIVKALDFVTTLSAQKLQFDKDAARQLKRRNERMAALSTSSIRDASGKVIGSLATIVLAPQQGNGQLGLYERVPLHPYGVDLGGFPEEIRDTRLLPRTIDLSAFEIVVPISSHSVDYDPSTQSPDTAVENAAENPLMYAVNLDLLGVRSAYNGHNELEGFVTKLGTVGLPTDEYQEVLAGESSSAPSLTTTVGRDKQTGQREGEPYALLNPHMDSVQLFALMCINNNAGGLAQGVIDDLPTQSVLSRAA